MATTHSKVPQGAVTLILVMSLLLFSLQLTEAQIGVSFGRQGNNLPSCQQTINMYKSNGIGRMRIYSPDQEVLQALRGTGIKLFLDVPNYLVQNIAQNQSQATQWVQQNVAPYASFICYIAVGNEVTEDQKQYVKPAMSNIQNALNTANSLANQISVTTSIGMSSIKNSFPPSDGEFTDVTFMDPIINFLKQYGSPLMLNVYPYFAYVNGNGTVSQDYALFTSPGVVFTDPNNGLQYRNIYDALVDSVYAALAKRGAPHVPVITGETGWPSGGGDSATVNRAAIYYRNFINHAKYGTPLKPGRREAYLFSMFDENLKPGNATEQHFGIFNTNGSPKYNGLNFSS